MKRMKVKPLLFLAILLFTFIGNSLLVLAEEPKKAEELEPVIYEKLEFKKKTEYLHDKQKTEMKNTIPKKQVDIYFDGRKKLPNRADTSYLFQTDERGEKSTVTAKSSELKLFSNKETTLSNEPSLIVEDEISGNSFRTILFFSLIGIGILSLFVIFLPKLANVAETTETSKETGRGI